MNEADALDIVQYAIWTVLTASGPAVAVAMLVGIGIALIQALTQIQEITLTFVPKIVAIMLVVALHRPVHRQPDLGLHQRHLRAHRERVLDAIPGKCGSAFPEELPNSETRLQPARFRLDCEATDPRQHLTGRPCAE